MSHIPSAAMPHAKTHEHPEPAQAPQPPLPSPAGKPVPWLALAIGGALAGAAITAALTLRSPTKPTKRRAPRKTATKQRAATTRRPRAPKAAK